MKNMGIYIEEDECLSRGLDNFKQAIHAVHSLVQSPIEMVFASALSAAATCTQGVVNVLCPGGGISPVSLNILINADSGERKTSTDKYFSKCISDFESVEKNRSGNKKISDAIETEIWKSKHKILKKEIIKALSEDEEHRVYALKISLAKHLEIEPTNQPEFRILYEDSTLPALLKNIANGWKIASINSSEGGVVLGRTSTEFLPYLNKLWDGEEIRVDRATRPSFIIKDARLSISVMTQKKILERFVKQGDGIARASGFLARCLVIEPKSTQGSRLLKLSAEQKEKNQKYIDWFHHRSIDILQNILEKGNSEKKVLVFTPEAQNIWHDFYRSVESELTENGVLSDVRDFASKISNNMSRIAAVLHCFCGNQGDINAEIARFSVKACKLFIENFKSIFGFKDPIILAQENAKKLHKFIYDRCMKGLFKDFQKRWLLQNGPYSCRTLVNMEAALSVLMHKNIVNIFSSGMNGQYLVGLTSYGLSADSMELSIQRFDFSWQELLGTGLTTGTAI